MDEERGRLDDVIVSRDDTAEQLPRRFRIRTRDDVEPVSVRTQEPDQQGSSAGYSVRKWGTHPLYVCDACPYATLDRSEIEQHVETHRSAERIAELDRKLRERR